MGRGGGVYSLRCSLELFANRLLPSSLPSALCSSKSLTSTPFSPCKTVFLSPFLSSPFPPPFFTCQSRVGFFPGTEFVSSGKKSMDAMRKLIQFRCFPLFFWNFGEFRTCLPPPFRCKETGQKHEKMHQIREFFFPLLSHFHFSRSWSEEFPSFFTSLAWHETQEKN